MAGGRGDYSPGPFDPSCSKVTSGTAARCWKLYITFCIIITKNLRLDNIIKNEVYLAEFQRCKGIVLASARLWSRHHNGGSRVREKGHVARQKAGEKFRVRLRLL